MGGEEEGEVWAQLVLSSRFAIGSITPFTGATKAIKAIGRVDDPPL